MPEAVGVRLRPAERMSLFATGGLELKEGDQVVVETARGLELGRVVQGPHQVDPEKPDELPPVLRKTSLQDLQQAQTYRSREREALMQARATAARLQVTMKLQAARYSLDGRLTLFFTADGRVDFRELVRALASQFHTRIELRQVGPRDETKVLGGLGCCGLPLCCAQWLIEFAPVSIRMAKEQELSLNQVKVSGQCGRLLCCLAYEAGQYRELRRLLPAKGTRVSTPLGEAKVTGGNPIKETVLVQLESGATVEVPRDQVSPVKP